MTYEPHKLLWMLPRESTTCFGGLQARQQAGQCAAYKAVLHPSPSQATTRTSWAGIPVHQSRTTFTDRQCDAVQASVKEDRLNPCPLETRRPISTLQNGGASPKQRFDV